MYPDKDWDSPCRADFAGTEDLGFRKSSEQAGWLSERIKPNVQEQTVFRLRCPQTIRRHLRARITESGCILNRRRSFRERKRGLEAQRADGSLGKRDTQPLFNSRRVRYSSERPGGRVNVEAGGRSRSTRRQE